MKLYRVMKVDADGKPRVGTKGCMLGVRPTDPANTDPRRRFDVDAVTDTDLVSPGKGLSTATTPAILVVRGGEAPFVIESDDLPDDYNLAELYARSLIRRDIDQLSKLASLQHWADGTPVPPEVFDSLWPEGPPAGWPAEPPASTENIPPADPPGVQGVLPGSHPGS